jgi:hypothetical protein
MAKSPFQTVLYHPFAAMLKRAAANGHRIEPVDKAAWAKYIRDNKVPIAGLMVYGQTMSESIRAVAIVGEGADDGLYVYSEDDEVSARFVREATGAAAGAAQAPEPVAPGATVPASPAPAPVDAPPAATPAPEAPPAAPA